MNLIDEEVAKLIPPLLSQDGLGMEALAVVKFFTPWTGWTWFVSEGSRTDDADWALFGKVVSPICPEGELGYFMLSELEEIAGPAGLKIERDLWWRPVPLRECR